MRTYEALDFSVIEREAIFTIDPFTVVCLVAWPLNESEAGVDLSTQL